MDSSDKDPEQAGEDGITKASVEASPETVEISQPDEDAMATEAGLRAEAEILDASEDLRKQVREAGEAKFRAELEESRSAERQLAANEKARELLAKLQSGASIEEILPPAPTETVDAANGPGYLGSFTIPTEKMPQASAIIDQLRSGVPLSEVIPTAPGVATTSDSSESPAGDYTVDSLRGEAKIPDDVSDEEEAYRPPRVAQVVNPADGRIVPYGQMTPGDHPEGGRIVGYQ